MSRRANKIKIDTLQSVELSEGVEIQLRIAGVFSRSLAFLLDSIFISVAVFLIGLIFLLVSQLVGDHYASGLYGLLMFVITWGYFFFMESSKRGATFGKRIVGLRVVNTSGGLPLRGQVFTRNLFRLIELVMLPLVGLCACLMTKRFQRAGDLVAGTVVVYDKTEPQLSMPLAPPVEALPPGWKLSREEQAAVVSFRERGGLWSEARQQELASHAQGLIGDTSNPVSKLVSVAEWLTVKR